MRRLVPLAVLSIAGLCVSFSAAQQQEPPKTPPAKAPQQEAPQQTFRKNVELVDVIFSVMNRRQKFVTDLDQKDFHVFEDNQPQEIRFFSRQTDLPLRVALLLDTSNSIRERLKFEQEAAIEFLYNVVRRKKDLALLMTFDDEPTIVQDFTDEVPKLRDAIMKQRAGGGTALFDAVYAACEMRLMNPPLPQGSPEVRRILVVISDGDDTLSKRARSEAIELAQRAGVAIYTISSSTQWVTAEEEADATKRVQRKYMKEAGDKALDQLAGDTGGRSFFPYRVDDLGQSFQDIGDELRSQYSLAYTPENQNLDGKFRKIQIRVDRKELKDLTIRARKGYYAPRNSAETSSPTPRAPGQ